MSYSERVLYDRYSIKDPEAKLNEGDIVVVTQEEIDPYTGNTKESRLIGIIRKEKGDIFDVTLKHSGDNDSDRKVLIDVPRNLLEYVVEQDYESVCARISRGIIAQEDVDDDEKKTFKKEIYEATRSMEFIPAGRILAGLGRDENQDFTLFNCYVFSIPSDSREGIGTHWLRLLNTYATGGGVGWNISILRPRGSLVKKVNGRSSGAVSWAEQFSQITGVVEQGGSRRGAGLQGLWVWHPDIEEFITTKSLYKKIDTKEGKRVEVCANLLTNSNVSVLISDDFMEAVEANDEWELIFPDTKYPDYDETWDGDIWKWQREGKPIEIYKTINARDLWQKIVYHAWRSGEPGILFLERFNKMSNSYYYDRIVCTNPCVTGDTKVATSTGYVNARDLKVGMKIRTLVGLRPIDKVYNNGKKKIYRVTFSDGGELDCTSDHELCVVRRKKYEWVEVKNLKTDPATPNDRVLVTPNEGCFGPERKLPLKALNYIQKRKLSIADGYDRALGVVIGAVIGDGSFRKNKSGNSHSYATTISFGGKEEKWMKIFLDLMESYGIHTHKQVHEKSFGYKDGEEKIHTSITLLPYMLGTLLANLDFPYGLKSPQKYVPSHMMSLNREFIEGLLDGLFSTDGSVRRKRDNPMLSFHTSSKKLAQQVRLLLLQFGIHGRIYKSTRDPNLTYDGRSMYGTGEKYDLLVMNEGIKKFHQEIGLSHPEKKEKLQDVADNWHYNGGSWLASVISVEDTGRTEEVFDVHEPETLIWTTNGYTSLDCGEQGLPSNGICNLSHLNLSKFIKEGSPEFPTKERSAIEAWELVDTDRLRKVIQLGVRFLDNCIGLNKYHDEATKVQQLKERRIGLGILGFGEMLMRLGLAYGSKQGVKFTESIFKFISKESYLASVELAKERGAFPAFEADKFIQSGFMRKHLPDVIDAVKEHGIRNVTLNSVAPTGSVGVLAETTTGIEPYFALSWTSTTRIGTAQEKMSILETIIDKFGEDEKNWPDYVVTVQRGITAAHHVKTQAAAQRWIDSSISKCIAAGTLIPTDKGLILIEAFADTHEIDTFVPTKGEFKTSGHRILSHYRAGQKPATRILLDNGAELVGATESHRVLTPKGWHRMADLKIGDIVLGRFQESHNKGGMPLEWTDNLRTNANAAVETPKHMTPAFAQFLGMLASAASTTEITGHVGITCKNDHVAVSFRKICQEIFGIPPKETIDARNGVLNLYLNSRNLVRFVESLISRGAYKKHAPVAVLQGSYDEKLAFLAGATLDGYATSQGLVVYEGMSKDLAYHIAEIARSFGMPRINQGRKWVAASRAYTYSITVSNEMQEIILPIEPHKRRTAIYKRFKVLVDVNNIARSTFHSRSKEYYTLRSAQYREKNYMFNTTAKALGVPADTPVHRVTKVEDYGIVEMHDVEVENAHEYVVNGIVSHNTVNLPAEATEDDVASTYISMWRQGCKGGTVYVDQSRDIQVLHVNNNGKNEPEPNVVSVMEGTPHPDETLRPPLDSGIGPTFSVETSMTSVHTTFRCDPVTGDPYDFFINAGKGEIAANAQAIARLISMALRWPNGKFISQYTRLDMIREQLHKIPGHGQVGFGPDAILSFPDAVAHAINKFLKGEYSLSSMPFGNNQLIELLKDLSAYNVPQEILNKWFVSSNGERRKELPSSSSSKGSNNKEFIEIEQLDQSQPQDFQEKEEEEDTLRFHTDICPSCHQGTWRRVPGKCPKCTLCGYKEC